MNFNERLSLLFKKLKLSVTAASKHTGIARTSLNAYLAGHANPTVSVIEKIAVATGVNLYWLILEQGPMLIKNLHSVDEILSESYAPEKQDKEWLNYFWEYATPDERICLKVMLRKMFPDVDKWLKEKEGGV